MARAIMLFLASLALAAAAPCCTSCGGSTVKYWALDTPNNECAVTCLDPHDKLMTAEFAILTGFKGKQAGSENPYPCKDAHFSTYNRTDTIGAGPIKILLDKFNPDAVVPLTEDTVHSRDFVVADMHDGDQKSVSFTEGKDGAITMTITPHANNQTWVVKVAITATDTAVSGVVDFNVPGKPGPPPCNLTVTLMTEYGGRSGKHGPGKRTLEFTDHTGTITKDPKFPLNTWVELTE